MTCVTKCSGTLPITANAASGYSRVLIAAWLGLAPDQGVHFGLDPAGICQLGDERGDPQVRRLNVPAWEV